MLSTFLILFFSHGTNVLFPFSIERDYRCLGQWSEGGVMYTFTHRRDVNIYECFAGVVVSSNEIFIIEAGTSCQRGLQPLAYGMKLVRQGELRNLLTVGFGFGVLGVVRLLSSSRWVSSCGFVILFLI